MKKSLFLFLLFGLGISALTAQINTNEKIFIGMFSIQSFIDDPEPKADLCDKKIFQVPEDTVNAQGYPTSQLNVLKADGFNAVHTYYPSNYATGSDFIASTVRLVQKMGMVWVPDARHWYRPVNKDTGINVYDNRFESNPKARKPESNCKAVPDYEQLFGLVFNRREYNSAIAGYQLTEEASYFHRFNKQNFAVWYDDTLNNLSVEVPPSNVKEAGLYFGKKIGSDPQKIFLMEAYHHGRLHEKLTDSQGKYHPQDYLKVAPELFIKGMPVVWWEGSYTAFNPDAWINVKIKDLNRPHYLGPIWNVRYARRFVPEVHKVLDIERKNSPVYELHYHSDTSNLNGNWLRFQAYHSLIYGARGIWFWGLFDAYGPSEKPKEGNAPDRFSRNNFPDRYNKFVAPLSRELHTLNEKGFWALKAEIASKTDSEDPKAVVPPVKAYLKPALKVARIRRKFRKEFFKNECYGIHYKVLTDGKDTLLLLTNPVNVAVTFPLKINALPGKPSRLQPYDEKRNVSVTLNNDGYLMLTLAPFEAVLMKLSR